MDSEYLPYLRINGHDGSDVSDFQRTGAVSSIRSSLSSAGRESHHKSQISPLARTRNVVVPRERPHLENVFQLCGVKAIATSQNDDNVTSAKSLHLANLNDKRRGSHISFPSISSVSEDARAHSVDTALQVTPLYSSDFGYHFERLVPETGMSLLKHPPMDTKNLRAELAATANKHIYSVQIVSFHHRGSRRQQSVHNLITTLNPEHGRQSTFSRHREKTTLSGQILPKSLDKTKSNKELDGSKRLARSDTKLDVLGPDVHSLTSSVKLTGQKKKRLVGLSKIRLDENLPAIDVHGSTLKPSPRPVNHNVLTAWL